MNYANNKANLNLTLGQSPLGECCSLYKISNFQEILSS